MQQRAIGNRDDARSVEFKQRREAHRTTTECVREETCDDEITEATCHTYHTFR